MNTCSRRGLLAGGIAAAGLAATGGLLMPRLVLAAGPAGRPGAQGEARFVFIILRGALDGLSAVPPCGDGDYSRLRAEIAIAAPGAADGALALDGPFALHPRLGFLHECYGAGELVVFHAVAGPYRQRSHFDGQDVLENGTPTPHGVQTGWLNRALAALPPAAGQGRQAGVALGQNLPLVMRGPVDVASWVPSRLAALDEDTLQRVQDLYAADPLLARRLADALATDAMTAGDGGMGRAGGGPGERYAEVVRACAGFLVREDGPRVAVFDTRGWDTHANEGGAQGQLGQRLGALDGGLRALKEGLGPVWRHTAVMLATEFGRTAAVNGTRGTDHGTATAAFLLGGAVRGGRVVADWPGLAARNLYQPRDLAATLDLRAVLKAVLQEHLGVPGPELERTVFPESGAAPALRDLIRT
ncbi:hypothetical protein GPROT2_00977 [Gammaproteobacteria bacterium]|nr:hypothetical protein GPROT2_00977 [Gammaproteobacteria bacterium]